MERQVWWKGSQRVKQRSVLTNELKYPIATNVTKTYDHVKSVSRSHKLHSIWEQAIKKYCLEKMG